MSARGEPISLCDGKYKGLTGWRDDSKNDTKKRNYIIVNMGSGLEKHTWVAPSSILKPIANPSNYAEAMLSQCPKIDKMVNKLVREIAKCTIWNDLVKNPEPLYMIVHQRLQEAIDEQVSKGSDATWRIINYP